MKYNYILLAIWAIFIIYWLVSSRDTKKTVYTANPAWRLLVGCILLGLGLILFQPTIPALQIQFIPDTTFFKILGCLMCLGGIGFAIWARRILGRNWSANPTIKENHELITAGPYGYIRHPIYTGILISLLGTAMVDGKIRAFILVVCCLIGLILKYKVEEKLMLQQFPDQYTAYKKRTKALIPFIF